MSIGSLGLPDWARSAYERRGVSKLYDWQRECMSIPGVLQPNEQGKLTNILYSSPTSGGKTLVSEIALIRRLEDGGVGLFVLPFVSVVTEKEKYFKDLCRDKRRSSLRVFSFYGGSVTPVAMLVNEEQRAAGETARVGICTMEKANIIVNYMIECGALNKLKILVIDEFHTLGDPQRGYLLDVLVAKVLSFNPNCQIVAMSATLPNLKSLAEWIRGCWFVSNFRPVPLREMLLTVEDGLLKDIHSGEAMRTVQAIHGSGMNGLLNELVHEVVKDTHSVLVFCPTKQKCEDLARVVARSLTLAGRDSRSFSERERLIAELRVSPGGLDKTLEESVPLGVAYHHSGLTVEERCLLETAYREGVLLCLCATSTLGAGVNLPSKRVCFAGPKIAGSFIDTAKYRQMAGRAGRAGQGSYGESIVICDNPAQAKMVLEMAKRSSLPPLVSALDMNGLQRLILDVLSVRKSLVYSQVVELAKNTFRWACSQDEGDINKAIAFLVEKQLVVIDAEAAEGKLLEWSPESRLTPTLQGRAICASGLDCAVGADVIEELQKVRTRGINLESDLHLVYLLVTAEDGKTVTIKWDIFRQCYEMVARNWPDALKLMDLADKQGLISQAVRLNKLPVSGNSKLFQRFYTACILWSLLNGDDVSEIAFRTGIPRGSLQSLRASSGSLAAAVATICQKMRWISLEAMIDGLSRRLLVGAGQAAALVPLMQIPHMSLASAQQLYIHGIFSPGLVARLRVEELADILRKGTSTLPSSEAEKILNEAKKTTKRLRRIANEEAKLKHNRENRPPQPQQAPPEEKPQEQPILSPSLKRQKTQERVSEGLRRAGGMSLTAAGSESARRTSDAQDQVYRVSLGSARGGLDESPKQPLITDDFRVASIRIPNLRSRTIEFVLAASFETAAKDSLIASRVFCGMQLVEKADCFARLFVFPRHFVNLESAEELAVILERPEVVLASEDAKTLFHRMFAVRGANFRSSCVLIDTCLARHLMDPDDSPSESDLMRRWDIGKSLRLVGENFHSHVGAVRTYLFACGFQQAFSEEQLRNMLLVDVPMLQVLARMEFHGIRVRPWHEALLLISRRLGDIQTRVDALAKRPVCMDSAEDVSAFLYDDMGFPDPEELLDTTHDARGGNGSKKRHRTTEGRVLRKLPGETGKEVSQLIMDYRKLRGVQSNAETLLQFQNTRVRAKFSLMDTGTGRLTSPHGPNLLCLENSFKTEDTEISIRQMLVADEHMTLISVDYSQIEVRILGHFSQDQKLNEILNKRNSDIFAEIVRLWKAPTATEGASEQVAAEERAGCKRIVYGLIYGMGIHAMADELGINHQDAETMRRQFFNLCPTVETFIQKTVRDAEANGFVDSLSHRRRFIHDFGRGNKRDKASAERQAINTLCQATAADIIKVAMVRIDRIFTNELRHANARILLQIHDELLIECNKEFAEQVKDVVAREMTRNVLDVALEVKWAFGPSWGELSEIHMPYK